MSSRFFVLNGRALVEAPGRRHPFAKPHPHNAAGLAPHAAGAPPANTLQLVPAIHGRLSPRSMLMSVHG